MLYEELLAETHKEGLSTEDRMKRLQELHEFIKSQHHLYDDHVSTLSDGSDQPPKFQE